MKLCRFLSLALLGITLASASQGAVISVQYQGSILEGAPGVDQGLPIFLSQSPNNVRFKFFVPEYTQLLSINSISVGVDVYDGESNGFEQGALEFVFNGIGQPNVIVSSFSGGLNSEPLALGGLLGSGDLPNALLEIQGDGIFFLRVNRNGNNKQGNDFFVTNPSVVLDGELAESTVPEPASMLSMAGGLLAVGIVILRRRSRRIVTDNA